MSSGSAEISKKEKKEKKELQSEIKEMIESAGFDAKKEKKDKKDKKEKEEKAEKEEKKEKKEKKRKNEEEESPESSSKKEKKESSTGIKTSSNISALYPDFKVTCVSENNETFAPVVDFKSIGFHSKLAPLTANFTKPTPIQAYSWPILLAGKDMVGIAETGSGKTLAFSLPILSNILKSGRSETDGRVKMLVIAPTRELAMQTFEVVNRVIPESICLYGGTNRSEQQRQIAQKKPFVVVGTPGRLVDFLRDGTLKISNLEYFVLDEADRMLDLGFEPDIREIVAAIPEKRQNVMFSATWPNTIQTMASRYLKSPVKIYIKAVDSSLSYVNEDGETVQDDQVDPFSASSQQKASTRVHQIVQVVKDPFARDPILLDLLKRYHSSRKNRVLIFVLYKKEADRIERLLKSNRWNCVSIHGDKAQRDRTEALASFKSGEVPLMIATDVAARGLDIPDVEYVINFTFPLTIEDYIHRIGRTGRGGATGIAHTLFTDADKPHSGELINVLKASKNFAEIPQDLYNYGTTTKKKVHKEYGSFYKELDPNVKASHVKFDNDE